MRSRIYPIQSKDFLSVLGACGTKIQPIRAANPITGSGAQKIIIQRWYHAETSRELDLRREPPEIDEWRPGQHAIVCDSPSKCRRYSEWTWYG